MLDDELAKHARLSGDEFGLGDVAVAPFVYNLLSILDNWQPRPIFSAGISAGIQQRQAFRDVVMIRSPEMITRADLEQFTVGLVG